MRLVDVSGKDTYSVTKLLNFRDNTQIAVLPNPVDNTLFITNVPANAELKLVSADGRTLVNRAAQAGSESVDMSIFVRGFYFLN